MRLQLKRVAPRETYTIGRLYIDGEYLCDTLEDRVRPRGVKVYAETAIPAGTYRVTMKVYSRKFGARPAYAWCRGRLPRLVDVPLFEGILIHAGNTERHTAGCILVGRNTIVGRLTESMETLKKLWKRLDDADKRGEPISISVE